MTEKIAVIREIAFSGEIPFKMMSRAERIAVKTRQKFPKHKSNQWEITIIREITGC